MNKLITSFGKTMTVVHKKEYDVDINDARVICQDYIEFLKVMLGDQKEPMNPNWDVGKAGEVGGTLSYTLVREGSVNVITEKIVRLENTADACILAWEQVKSQPQLPLSGYGCVWEFHRSSKDPTKTNLVWTRHFKDPLALGFISVGGFLSESFKQTARHIMEIFRTHFGKEYPKRFPRKGEKIVIVGAGPSGLHMAHLLIEKGYGCNNITILEKSDRYGGKTVTLKDHTAEVVNATPVVHELGTCYLHPAYYAVRSLFLDMTKMSVVTQLSGWVQELTLIDEEQPHQPVPPAGLFANAGARVAFVAVLQSTRSWLSSHEGKEADYDTFVAKLRELQTLISRTPALQLRLSGPPGPPIADPEQYQGVELFARSLARFKEIAPQGTVVQTSGNTELAFEKWVTSKLQIQPQFSLWSLPRIMFPTADTAAELILAKDKYNRLHNQYFGVYNYTMPPPLSAEAMKELDMPFGDFLNVHKLTALTAVLAYGQTCQGYGTIEQTPTFWAMCWITPELLNQYFALHPEHEKKTMVKQGWITLWDEIVRLDGLEANRRIVYNVDIESIVRRPERRRQGGGRVVVDYSIRGGQSKTEEFDFLIMACPIVNEQIVYNKKKVDLDYEVQDPSKTTPIDSRSKIEFRRVPPPSMLDLSEEEARVFGANIENGQFRTTLFKTAHPQPFVKDHLVLYMDKILGLNAGQGEVFASRDSYLAVHPEYTAQEAHLTDPNRFNLRERMAYQYVENNLGMPEDRLREKFNAWADVYIGPNREVLFEKTWEYFRRFNAKGIKSYDPWAVLTLQGKNSTLFVHASTFFESVLDIVNYNNMLYSSLTGEFNDISFSHPTNDEKPVEQPGLIDKFRHFLGRFLLPPVSFVMNIVFTGFYILLWPLNNFVIWRLQNWSLQRAFHTKNIGWWPFSMSLAKFIDVSPSVLPFSDPTVKEDPIVTTLFTDPDAITVPGVQRVASAALWNYQDYRVMIAEWQRLVKPTNLSFIGPRLKRVFTRFRYYFPVTYNYMFSWGAGIGFAHLTGWGYKIDDEDGGGWHVPKCAMLDMSRKKFGDEVGSRVCTHVCKIFTEEWLKKKGMDCTLEPNHVTGSCTIRGISPRATCCSDNSVLSNTEW